MEAAEAETSSTWAETSSVEAETSSTAALFSSLTLAMFSMAWVSSEELAAISSVAAVFSSMTAETESTASTSSAAAALTFAAAVPGIFGLLVDGFGGVEDVVEHLHRPSWRCTTPASTSAAEFLHGGDGFADGLLDALDERGDLLGGQAGAFGQFADFIGDDGKALALLTGAGGFDGGIERQQVGLARRCLRWSRRWRRSLRSGCPSLRPCWRRDRPCCGWLPCR